MLMLMLMLANSYTAARRALEAAGDTAVGHDRPRSVDSLAAADPVTVVDDTGVQDPISRRRGGPRVGAVPAVPLADRR